MSRRNIALIERKAESGRPLRIEEAMVWTHRKSCRRISPGSHEAKNFQFGTILITKREVVIVCRPQDTGFYPADKEKMLAVLPSNPASLGYLTGSRLITDYGLVLVSSEERLERDAQFLGILTKHSKAAKRHGVERRGDENTPQEMLRLGRPGNGSFRKICCPEEAGILGALSGERLRRSLRTGVFV
ncbi:hypothetical protein IT397_02260 [Candidatus Nomurabacteria bacterium]|nr:hypothetical protein [Candidatus Nomurabacteria bacterium]